MICAAAVVLFVILASACQGACTVETSESEMALETGRYILIDHRCTDIDSIPEYWADRAAGSLHVAYGHTSHGSQITTGMEGLTEFRGEPFIYRKSGGRGSIDLRDNPFKGAKDLGSPDNRSWAEATDKYLTGNSDINVVMWSWCGQLSGADDEYVDTYLELMQWLEERYPDVLFVYMTGHLDGTGEDGRLRKNNDRIRNFCMENGKVLYDFADIESYNPDGEYFVDRNANDKCYYDSNGDGKLNANWGRQWQREHTEGIDWYQCEAAHTQPVNANMKAYAAWWMFSRVAGWDGEAASSKEESCVYYADSLWQAGLLRGTATGLNLDWEPTRLEGAAMITRLLGGEKEALDESYSHPFADAADGWGSPYVGYLYRYGLTKGVSAVSFGAALNLRAVSYATYMLRILGYSDDPAVGDFSWSTALSKAQEIGAIGPDYRITLESGFNRGHMARITYRFLFQKLKGTNQTLLDKLVSENVVDSKTAQKLVNKR